MFDLLHAAVTTTKRALDYNNVKEGKMGNIYLIDLSTSVCWGRGVY